MGWATREMPRLWNCPYGPCNRKPAVSPAASGVEPLFSSLDDTQYSADCDAACPPTPSTVFRLPQVRYQTAAGRSVLYGLRHGHGGMAVQPVSYSSSSGLGWPSSAHSICRTGARHHWTLNNG